ncbi:TnsA endonuclease N-terminal domain-containing protein [Burkholderia anthina]|uniref:TnsA endonuclease N-terminal domain-containing protein n=2 Tax=Burkholderia anthina TaxID=179879 RepID=A0A7T7AKP6_9BURK|nr:TnsA endonuclease N-terminal domain-containing protein [Burkholderia anthina]QQK05862.1 TnsA endonuclease N-terminal domain-containing protein [Burkholderia anthina]
MKKTTTARKVLTRSGRRTRYLYPSTKNRALIQCESRLEFNAAMHFEFSPDVMRYREQPTEVTYRDRNDRVRKYFPDFELTMKNGALVHVEIKPSSKLRQAELRERLQDIAQHYAYRGQLFKVLTERDVGTASRIANLEHLSYHRRPAPSGFERVELLRRLAQVQPLTFGRACSIAGSEHAIMRLLSAGCLEFDSDTALTNSTVLAFASEEQS